MKLINTPDGHFVDGNGSNIKGTIVPAKWLNAIQDEITNTILAAGLELSDETNQLLMAIGFLNSVDIENHVNELNPHDQYALKADVLKSFIGMAFPYGKAIPPAGWVSYDGTAINPVTSPILASIYGTHLPNLCGVVLRGWDKGRGLDPGRELLSYQGDAIRNIVGTFGEVFSVNEASSGAFSFTSAGKSTTIASANQRSILKFSAADAGVPTANENIMKNVAMHFITPIG